MAAPSANNGTSRNTAGWGKQPTDHPRHNRDRHILGMIERRIAAEPAGELAGCEEAESERGDGWTEQVTNGCHNGVCNYDLPEHLWQSHI